MLQLQSRVGELGGILQKLPETKEAKLVQEVQIPENYKYKEYDYRKKHGLLMYHELQAVKESLAYCILCLAHICGWTFF